MTDAAQDTEDNPYALGFRIGMGNARKLLACGFRPFMTGGSGHPSLCAHDDIWEQGYQDGFASAMFNKAKWETDSQ